MWGPPWLENHSPQYLKGKILLASPICWCMHFCKGLRPISKIYREATTQILTPRLIVLNGPFQQWGLYFVGEINPSSSGQHKWILVATDYFTKWIEVVPTRNGTHQVIMRFLYENIFSMFGFPAMLVTYNAPSFKAWELVKMCESMGIQLVHSTSYYPQGNGLAESSNKSLSQNH